MGSPVDHADMTKVKLLRTRAHRRSGRRTSGKGGSILYGCL